MSTSGVSPIATPRVSRSVAGVERSCARRVVPSAVIRAYTSGACAPISRTCASRCSRATRARASFAAQNCDQLSDAGAASSRRPTTGRRVGGGDTHARAGKPITSFPWPMVEGTAGWRTIGCSAAPATCQSRRHGDVTGEARRRSMRKAWGPTGLRITDHSTRPAITSRTRRGHPSPRCARDVVVPACGG